MQSDGTIAAIATPSGSGGICVIRISGPKAREIAKTLLVKSAVERFAVFTDFVGRNGEVLDNGIALLYKAPQSYTGEDVLELQGHGGRIVSERLLSEVLMLGARPANPGEFTQRAFLNNKMDLTQAESVADIIGAANVTMLRASLKSLSGSFKNRVERIAQGLLEIRVHVEAYLDFPDEEIDVHTVNALTDKLTHLRQDLALTIEQAQRSSLLREAFKLVLVGPPNVGKSSLLNALTGEQSAIVTDIPGTTRDLIREHIEIQGIRIELVDTAGLRQSDNLIEQIGIQRSYDTIKDANVICYVSDHSNPTTWDKAQIKSSLLSVHQFPEDNLPLVWWIHNKVDLTNTVASEDGENFYLSAEKGLGIEQLRKRIVAFAAPAEQQELPFMARKRHLNALESAMQYVCNAKKLLHQASEHDEESMGLELLAEELRIAHTYLGEISGQVTSEQLLGEIFSGFCIGK